LHSATVSSRWISLCNPIAVAGWRKPAVPDPVALARLLLWVLVVTMKDLLFVAVTIVFFAATWAYTRACARL
jgi:hypothetical protein